jgi:cbb3-type cytochrome oxidase subunit 3
MFTTGRIIFVAIFVLAFIAMLVWSYGKEKKLNKIHFDKSYKILIALILFFVTLFMIVKLRKYL